MSKRIISRYPNGVSVKSYNKRFSIIEKDAESVILEFLVAGDKAAVNEPRAHHSVIKNAVTSTQICVSVDRVQDMIDALTAYKEKMVFDKLRENWKNHITGDEYSITYIHTPNTK